MVGRSGAGQGMPDRAPACGRTLRPATSRRPAPCASRPDAACACRRGGPRSRTGWRVGAGEDQILDPRRHLQHLEDAGAAAIAAAAAARAADRLVETGGLSASGSVDIVAGGQRGDADRPSTHPAALHSAHSRRTRRCATIRRSDEATMNGSRSMLSEPQHGAWRVVGVQRRQHQVAGQRRLERDVGGLGIADLADHHHVRILTQEAAQHGGVGQGRARLTLHLRDAVDPRLDRILGGQQRQVLGVEAIEQRVERRALAAAGRSGDEQQAVRQIAGLSIRREVSSSTPRSVRSRRARVRSSTRSTIFSPVTAGTSEKRRSTPRPQHQVVADVRVERLGGAASPAPRPSPSGARQIGSGHRRREACPAPAGCRRRARASAAHRSVGSTCMSLAPVSTARQSTCCTRRMITGSRISSSAPCRRAASVAVAIDQADRRLGVVARTAPRAARRYAASAHGLGRPRARS